MDDANVPLASTGEHQVATNGDASPRPYALWDTHKSRYCPGRHYVHLENAHLGAGKELRFHSPPGRTLELMNKNSNRVILTYRRRVHGIDWS